MGIGLPPSISRPVVGCGSSGDADPTRGLACQELKKSSEVLQFLIERIAAKMK